MATSRPIRCGVLPRPATKKASPRAGSTSQASSILAWKASATQTPASTALRQRPFRMADTVASAASTSSRIMSESGMLPRFNVDRGRAGRQHHGGHQPGQRPAQSSHAVVEHEHRQRALHGRGRHDGPLVEAEEPHRQGLHPQGAGELVDRDRAGGVEGAEDEVVPVLRHGAHGGGVEDLDGRADVPGVGQRGQGRHEQEAGRAQAGWSSGERHTWKRRDHGGRGGSGVTSSATASGSGRRPACGPAPQGVADTSFDGPDVPLPLVAVTSKE